MDGPKAEILIEEGAEKGRVVPIRPDKALEGQGFAKLFGPGTKTDDIADFIEREMADRWAEEGADV